MIATITPKTDATPDQVVRLCRQAIDDAQALKSKLTPEAMTGEGYSGKCVRHLVNNLAAAFTPYVEVGCYQGSTLIAAGWGNKGLILGIDNFSDETKPGQYMVETRRRFLCNLAKWSGEARPAFIDGSCWDVALSGVQCCFFDGDHSEQSHYDSIDKLYGWFDQVFVFAVDDFNRENVRTSTQAAIASRGLSIHFSAWLGRNGTDDREGWWNGVGVYVLGKE